MLSLGACAFGMTTTTLSVHPAKANQIGTLRMELWITMPTLLSTANKMWLEREYQWLESAIHGDTVVSRMDCLREEVRDGRTIPKSERRWSTRSWNKTTESSG